MPSRGTTGCGRILSNARYDTPKPRYQTALGRAIQFRNRHSETWNSNVNDDLQ